MYKLLDWTDPSSGGLLVALAVIVGGLVTWRLLSRARNVAAEEKADLPDRNLSSPTTAESRGSTIAGGKRKKRRRGSGGAGQQPRSQRKKRNKSKLGKDASDREKESGTQESSNSSDSDRLQQDASEKEERGDIECCNRPQADDERQIVCRDHPSDNGRREQEVLSNMVILDRSVVSVDDGQSHIVQEPVDEPVKDTLMMSTIGFVEDHFRHEDEEEKEATKELDRQEEEKQQLDDSVSESAQHVILKGALMNEEGLLVTMHNVWNL